MKQLATVTLIVAHNPLNAQERWDPASTVELITDLLEESYDAEVDILHAEAQPMILRHDGPVDEDLDRRRREMDARLAKEREERHAELLANDPNVYKP